MSQNPSASAPVVNPFLVHDRIKEMVRSLSANDVDSARIHLGHACDLAQEYMQSMPSEARNSSWSNAVPRMQSLTASIDTLSIEQGAQLEREVRDLMPRLSILAIPLNWVREAENIFSEAELQHSDKVWAHYLIDTNPYERYDDRSLSGQLVDAYFCFDEETPGGLTQDDPIVDDIRSKLYVSEASQVLLSEQGVQGLRIRGALVDVPEPSSGFADGETMDELLSDCTDEFRANPNIDVPNLNLWQVRAGVVEDIQRGRLSEASDLIQGVGKEVSVQKAFFDATFGEALARIADGRVDEALNHLKADFFSSAFAQLRDGAIQAPAAENAEQESPGQAR